MSDYRGQLATPADALRYMLGGKATITVQSRKTGARYTYKLSRAREIKEGQSELDVPIFVSVLSGNNNDDDYRYMCCLFASVGDDAAAGGRAPVWTRGSKVAADAPSARAFKWMWGALAMVEATERDNPYGLGATHRWDQMEIWHEGSCSRCGRTLTVPESIATGLGPVCASRM